MILNVSNSDDFVFDNEMLVQAVYFGFTIGEIAVRRNISRTSPRSISAERQVRIRRPRDFVEISAMGYHALVDLRYQGRSWDGSNKG
jgi:hypothetical protein